MSGEARGMPPKRHIASQSRIRPPGDHGV